MQYYGISGIFVELIVIFSFLYHVIDPEIVTCEAGTFEVHRIQYISVNQFSGTASIINITRGRFERDAEASHLIWIAEGLGWVKQEITNHSGTMVYEIKKLVQ